MEIVAVQKANALVAVTRKINMYGKINNPEEYGKWTRAIKKWWRHLKCRLNLCKGEGKCSCFCHEPHWSCCGAGKKPKK
jgi:hypothetical protein